MELIKGYKQTEVGIIPKDWEVVDFAKIADSKVKWSITGGPFGSNLKTSDYTNEGIQIIQLQNIGDGEFIDKDKVYTSVEKADELLSSNIYPNEIILSKMGDPVARACFIPTNKNNRYLMASDGIRLVVDENCFDKKFIHDYINSSNFRNRAFDVSIGTTRLRIGLPVLKSLKVIKPGLAEQQAIAKSLTDTDQLIQNLKALISKKKAIKQGAMHELLTGKKRLQGFTEKWETKKLGSSGKTISGLSGKTKTDFGSGNAQYITFMNVMSNVVIDTSILKKVNIKQGETQNTFKKGDLFFNTSSETPEEVGMCAVLLDDIQDVYLNSFCFGYRLNNEDLNGLYLSYLINSNIGRSIFESLAQGATRYNLSKTNFNNVILNVPKDIKEQQAIAQILSDMDAEIEVLEKQLHKIQSLKQGMMQELLTGKTRLVESAEQEKEKPMALVAEPEVDYKRHKN